jgi:hypothetical protein
MENGLLVVCSSAFGSRGGKQMRHENGSRLVLGFLALVAAGSGCAAASDTGLQKDVSKMAATPGAPIVGRYQLVGIQGHPGNPFLIDTTTGCVWQYVQNEKTKRSTFVEADVENLHWGWGSGAQQILAAQIDSLNSPEEQKRVLKQNLQKTECGQFNVTLSPESRKSEQPPEK